MPKTNYSDITVVLDRSGSMKSIADDTIGGMNRFVDDQKKQPGEATYSLFQFDDIYEPVHRGIPLATVPPLTQETFVPRGWTALLDAIGRSINEAGSRFEAMPEHERPSVVIFVIMTDGMENYSKEFTRDKIASMISHQRDVYGWNFIFLGANQDAIAVAGEIGIASAMAMNYAANAGGVREVLQKTSGGIGLLRAAGAWRGYSDEDRKAQELLGAKKD